MDSYKKSALEISVIENGTVIDHIPSQNLFDVMQILGLNKIENRITFGTNLKSKKISKKAIIKIVDWEMPQSEFSKITPFAPKAHVSYIKDFKVTEKLILTMPDEVVGIVRCANPVCVTNRENLNTHFEVVDKENVALKCKYCEKITNSEQFKVK